MSLDKYHLSKKGENWQLKKEGNQRATETFEGTKSDAIKESSAHLKKGEGASLRIHKTDGKIQEERTYPRSKDPKSSKG
ncbi:DUF2188 domain-containing protein [Nonlabens marinus]|uniref:DUF2188 domain-containing protein n=1 Tax=Nonlabens marinus S1-08 TaxID=1454201 RepID=W8VR79_9FLAO|nr:DUF2188 domain-containing protein [Nonlabens marinus]BAO56124.1 hypothetical protein NMS_2115 [Nonlabens marinus S1-08]